MADFGYSTSTYRARYYGAKTGLNASGDHRISYYVICCSQSDLFMLSISICSWVERKPPTTGEKRRANDPNCRRAWMELMTSSAQPRTSIAFGLKGDCLFL